MVAQQQLARHAAPANEASGPAHNTAAHDRASSRDPITPMQRWAHELVLEMLKANLPLPSLAAHLKIPFNTLIDYINLPEVRAEIDAYEELCALRARLLGQTARPISLRRLLDVLESPTPQPSGRDPDADQRTLHRHAELIRRTATTIARESRALIPKPTSKPAPKPAPRPAPPVAHEPQKGAPSASSASSGLATDTRARDSAPTQSPTSSGATSSRRVPSGEKPELVLDPPTPTPTPTPSSITDNSTNSPPPSPTTSSSVSLCLSGESSSPSPSASSAALRVEPSSSSSPCPSVALRGESSSPVRALLRVCGTTRARDHPAP